MEFLQEIEVAGGHVGMGGDYEEGEEPDPVYRSNGRSREQRLTASGALLRLSPKTKAEHSGIIGIKYYNCSS